MENNVSKKRLQKIQKQNLQLEIKIKLENFLKLLLLGRVVQFCCKWKMHKNKTNESRHKLEN